MVFLGQKQPCINTYAGGNSQGLTSSIQLPSTLPCYHIGRHNQNWGITQCPHRTWWKNLNDSFYIWLLNFSETVVLRYVNRQKPKECIAYSSVWRLAWFPRVVQIPCNWGQVVHPWSGSLHFHSAPVSPSFEVLFHSQKELDWEA